MASDSIISKGQVSSKINTLKGGSGENLLIKSGTMFAIIEWRGGKKI
jgi:hypothetical protein